MKYYSTRIILEYLQEIGWSDLIDSRWRNNVIADIRSKFPQVDDETLEEVLKIVLI
jgi:hypothetical protein